MTKVCPKCCCDTFEVVEYSHRSIYTDGNGEYMESGNDWYLDKHQYPAECVDCGEKYDDLSSLITIEEYNAKVGL